MGIAEILALITGVLQFPKVILEFVKLLKKSPAEKHEDILKQIAHEAEKFEESGRPSW
jgi:hypothetical protein